MIDFDKAKEKMSQAGGFISEKAGDVGGFVSDRADEVKEKAVSVKDDIDEKINELDNMLSDVINEYNDTYTLMSDKGLKLFIERTRALDTIKLTETLVNSIANHPKEFDAEFEIIDEERKDFTDSCEFADKELQAARTAAGGAGAGAAAGAAVAFMAPTAAMWAATTFGTASTGVAISTLSGAAAESAALAWLGGGALSASGGGVAAGNALLAMAGPIGWTIAGATLLTSIVLFAKKKLKLNKEKNDEIQAVKENIEKVREVDAKISAILDETVKTKEGLDTMYVSCLDMFNGNYVDFSDDQKQQLGALVNNTKALSAMFKANVE